MNLARLQTIKTHKDLFVDSLCNMDIDMLKLLLNTDPIRMAPKTDVFLYNLYDLFERAKERNEFNLIACEALTVAGPELNPDESCVLIVSPGERYFFPFIFEVRNSKVVGIRQSEGFIPKDIVYENYGEYVFSYKPDELVDFEPDAEFEALAKACDKALSKFYGRENILWSEKDYNAWLEYNKELINIVWERFHTFERFGTFYFLSYHFYHLNDLLRTARESQEILDAYQKIESGNEKDRLNWLFAHEEDWSSIRYSFPAKSDTEHDFIDCHCRYHDYEMNLYINEMEFLPIYHFRDLYSKLRLEIIEKYHLQGLGEEVDGPDSDEIPVELSLEYQLRQKGLVE